MGFSDKYKKRTLELHKELGALENVYRRLEVEFPDTRTPDEKTIWRWRQSSPAHIHIEQNITNPITLNSIKKHYRDLTTIAKKLLENELDLIMPMEISGESCWGIERDKDKYEIFEAEWATKLLFYNLENIREQYRPLDMIERFDEHFKNDSPSRKGLTDLMTHQPFELINLLKMLAQRGTFKGTCKICKGFK